ncbi:AraC-like ligand-binding domain-containing protein [Streptomyces katsurahamanus]|uniref:Helix-turn-helix domain-containing protein n=1 Tax=Streptomyces katsurahamanus TaxID=2577098 RepID=A0ABW9NX97_9ACTN|nr:helix-turn-helix domain-containing protein [Streptomyces katsurahamanus]MQS37751.1 helix-turn-helix domain-containing protein [Streptomyces katsurahamanus]
MTTAPTQQPLPSVVFSSLDVAAPDRFARWRELLGSTHAPMDLHSDHAADFRARQRVIGLGDVAVWPAAFPPVMFRRTAKLIRQSDPENYHLSLMLRGGGAVTWHGRELRTRPGVYHSNDSSRPVEIRTGAQPRRIVMIGVEVPKAVLPLPRQLADRAVGLPMPDGHGVGALLAQFLTQFVRSLTDYRLSDAPRLGAVVTDLVATVFAHTLDRENALPPHTHRYTTVLRIKAFIQQNLADPRLTPTAVAAAHNISTGYLHRIFRDEGVTVAALIRRTRLERARDELADPIRAGEHIHTIAARWGLTAPEFSRSFRAAYGMTPSDHRHLHLHLRRP